MKKGLSHFKTKISLIWGALGQGNHQAILELHPNSPCVTGRRQPGRGSSLSDETIYSTKWSWMPKPPHCCSPAASAIYSSEVHRCRAANFFQRFVKMFSKRFASIFDSLKHAVSGLMKRSSLNEKPFLYKNERTSEKGEEL